MVTVRNNNTEVDFQANSMPAWVREVIETHLAIENEDAQSAGTIGYMARALVIATMPYKDPKADSFVRHNGDFKLRIVAGYEGGIPFGIYPRLLVSWVATEAVRNQSPVIELGDSLRAFLRDVLELRSSGGGPRGAGARVTEQMKRLFGSLITAQYTGDLKKRGFTLRNVLLADELDLEETDFNNLEAGEGDEALWTPHQNSPGEWRSQVKLSRAFYNECTSNPIPIDLRAYKALRGSPLAMDVYTWLTYRMSYTNKRSRPIRWESLMMQFGSNFNTQDMGQAVRDFKKAFLTALKLVLFVYPAANLEINENGLVLLPSQPHVLPLKSQQSLF